MVETTKSLATTPSSTSTSCITTLIFDVDDTLYDVGTNFAKRRDIDGTPSFMVAKLNFPDMVSAKIVRDEYFARYHSSAKGLSVAEKEGKLPPPPTGWPKGKQLFDPKDLSEWWAEKLDYSLLHGPYRDLADMLALCPLRLVAFSNGPRKYVLRILRELGLDAIFSEDNIFAVDDVLPSCKPEKEAFKKVFKAIGVKDPSECVMVEDSMKNIRVAKSLGMKTVLVTGIGRRKSNIGESQSTCIDIKRRGLGDDAEATKPGDAPDEDDPAVDVCIESVIEIKKALPELWK